jgi:anionic cell wall polymer biosynthesis LytR-Cps2A-Psr (LCP) family protein
MARASPAWNTVTKLPRIVKIMNENVNTNLEIVQPISLGRTLVRHGADREMRFAQLKEKPEILPNGEAVLVPDQQANASILEGFRYGGSQVRSLVRLDAATRRSVLRVLDRRRR